MDATATSGTVATAEVDCYAIPDVAQGDQVGVRHADNAYWVIVDGTGTAVCYSEWNVECTLTGTGGWSLLVYDRGGDQTLSYPSHCIG